MASSGFLTASVYTSDARIPVEGASVVISATDADGRRVLLGMEITDENGRTSPVRIQTPERALSEAPGDTTAFSSVMLTIFHPAYEPMVIERVQVFPETTTTQEAALQPLTDDPHRRNEVEIFNITPQDL